MKKTVTVALIGMGWAGSMHARSYRKVSSVDLRLKTLCAVEPESKLEAFVKTYGFEQWTDDYGKVLKDPEIEIVDIVTPPSLHAEMVTKALEAGKNVICEKPLTGFFGNGEERAGLIPKQGMLDAVTDELDRISALLKSSGKHLYYSEQWVYGPPFTRALDIILKKKTVLLSIHGLTGHKGSEALHARWWKYNGGGTLIRQGTHPIGAILYMKKQEMENRGLKFGILDISCDAACLSNTLAADQKERLDTVCEDIEDWAQLTMTFSDHTKAVIVSGDVFHGQIYNRIEAFGNDSVYDINMTPNNLLDIYMADDKGIEKEPVMEKSGGNIGWKHALVCEEVIRGFTGELDDFFSCAAENQDARSGFELARDTLLVVYGAYLSAEHHKTVNMEYYFK